jgi:nitrilase
MLSVQNPIVVAVAQVAPVFLNGNDSTEKACEYIIKSAQNGAKLVVFPEAFLPAYPDWIWLIPGHKKAQLNDLYAELLANAISIPDDTTKKLCKAAKSANIYVAIGINERNSEASNASLFNTLLFIDSAGNIMGKHRKLIPTGGERLIWAQGDGSTLNVFDTPFGKIGALICWENYMPLARNAMYGWGAQILLTPTWDSSEMWLTSVRHIAREGGLFVISCCQAIHKDHIPDHYEFKKLYAQEKEWINPGNSTIVNPAGKIIAGPISQKEELLYAELDYKNISDSKWLFDAAGHYARPDIFKFSINKKSNKIINPR